MKIYGVGVLTAPNTNRVIHNFDNGYFDTVNPMVIQAAEKQGFSFEPIEPIPVKAKADSAKTVKVIAKKRGRKKR